MARNFTLAVLRGLKANIPPLSEGELYLATDELQLYVGTALGNHLVISDSTATPTGAGGGVSAPKHLAGNPGPLNPMKIVSFTKIIIAGVVYWMPLFQ